MKQNYNDVRCCVWEHFLFVIFLLCIAPFGNHRSNVFSLNSTRAYCMEQLPRTAPELTVWNSWPKQHRSILYGTVVHNSTGAYCMEQLPRTAQELTVWNSCPEQHMSLEILYSHEYILQKIYLFINFWRVRMSFMVLAW